MREAEIHLSDEALEALGAGSLLTVLRTAGLQSMTEFHPEGVLEIRVAEPIPADRLDAIEQVQTWERVADSSAGTTYICEVDLLACVDHCPMSAHPTTYEVAAIRPDGLVLRLVGAQAELAACIEGLRDRGAEVRLERLGEYTGPAETIDQLTERQREVLETAQTLGYFDVPRTASVQAVAEEIGLDPSTVSEHLQRAERSLLEDVLSTPA